MVVGKFVKIQKSYGSLKIKKSINHSNSSKNTLMAQKSEEIMPDPDAIIRLRRDRLLGANLTGCDVNFCWVILIRKFEESSPPPLPLSKVWGNVHMTLLHAVIRLYSLALRTSRLFYEVSSFLPPFGIAYLHSSVSPPSFVSRSRLRVSNTHFIYFLVYNKLTRSDVFLAPFDGGCCSNELILGHFFVKRLY